MSSQNYEQNGYNLHMELLVILCLMSIQYPRRSDLVGWREMSIQDMSTRPTPFTLIGPL